MSVIELDLLVEVTPWTLSDTEPPPGSLGGDPAYEAWASHCFEGAGISSSAIVGRWFVRAREVRGDLARRILAVESKRQDLGSDDFEDNGVPLDGGIGIWVDGVVTSVPACCSDVGACEWAVPTQGAWSEIWNGHDGNTVALRRTGGDVEVRLDGAVVGKIGADDLARALHAVTEESSALAVELERLLSATPMRTAVARRLAGARV